MARQIHGTTDLRQVEFTAQRMQSRTDARHDGFTVRCIHDTSNNTTTPTREQKIGFDGFIARCIDGTTDPRYDGCTRRRIHGTTDLRNDGIMA